MQGRVPACNQVQVSMSNGVQLVTCGQKRLVVPYTREALAFYDAMEARLQVGFGSTRAQQQRPVVR